MTRVSYALYVDVNKLECLSSGDKKFNVMTKISSHYVDVNKIECLSSGDKKFN